MAQTLSNLGRATVTSERQQLLKLFLALQATGLVLGAAVTGLARIDPLAGMGLGLGIGSANFGVSLTLSSKRIL